MKTRRKVADPWQVWCYLSCDYAALELCTLAQCIINLGFESEMGKAINAGQDLHTRLGSSIGGWSYEEGMAKKKAKDPQMLALRQTSKPVNFGCPGLMGPPKMVFTARKDGVYFCELADGWAGEKGRGCAQHPRVVTYGSKGHAYAIAPTCERCLALAKEYKEAWYATWPEMREYHKITIAAAKECERGIPVDSFGTGLLRMETSANAVSNHFFQNLAAQGAKHAAWLVAKEAYTDTRSVLYNNARMTVFVHDEWMGEVREPVAHECGYRIAEIMKQGMREFCPDVEIEIQPALCRRWFKGAEAVKDRQGRLRPWWPPDSKQKWDWGPDQALMQADLSA